MVQHVKNPAASTGDTEMRIQSLGQERVPQGEEMVTHSPRILA